MLGTAFLFIVLLLSTSSLSQAAGFIAGHSTANGFAAIPEPFLARVREQLHIYYNHTSHGSQLVTGLNMLAGQGVVLPGGLHDAASTDLGDSSWPDITRTYLENNPATNVVMWSWCGQLNWMSEAAVDTYLAAMAALETDYPAVAFVYMTGHLDGSGLDGTLYRNNDRIRAYCRENGKVLFDFADIESFDPANSSYPDGSDVCEWCEDWCQSHECPSCGDCAHSHCFNCFRKGQALWGLLARLVGYRGSGGLTVANVLLFM